jgi:hypothetical protein
MLAGGVHSHSLWTIVKVESADQEGMSKTAANFMHALAAVLAGNAIYFLLMKYLPPRARHVPLQVDLGLVVDFCLCLVIFGLIKTVARRRR